MPPGSALVGFRTPTEVTENLGALGWEIGNAYLAEIDAILDHHGAITVPPGWLEDRPGPEWRAAGG